MRTKTLTKAQAATMAKLQAAKDSAMWTIYGAASDTRTVFSECVKLAPEADRLAYSAAVDAIAQFERQMVDECRAYFTPSYRFVAY